MRVDFDKVKGKKTQPTVDGLIKEPAVRFELLLKACQVSRFVDWLKWCRATCYGSCEPPGIVINYAEQTLRLGPSQSQASAHQQTTLLQRPAPASGRQGPNTTIALNTTATTIAAAVSRLRGPASDDRLSSDRCGYYSSQRGGRPSGGRGR
ncbi:hypothetical protein VTH06DRAFT_4578 [Thermothelomyces fergusii]